MYRAWLHEAKFGEISLNLALCSQPRHALSAPLYAGFFSLKEKQFTLLNAYIYPSWETNLMYAREPEMQTDGFTDARGFSQPYTRPSACDCQPTLLLLPKGTMWQRTRAKTTRQQTPQKLNRTSIVTLATSQEIPCELCSRFSETWLASSCIYSGWRNALSV